MNISGETDGAKRITLICDLDFDIRKLTNCKIISCYSIRDKYISITSKEPLEFYQKIPGIINVSYAVLMSF